MKKSFWSNFILILVFLTGLSLLLYPTVSDWWNSMHQSQVVASYVQDVAKIDNTKYEEMLLQVEQYNKSILERPFHYEMTEEELQEYEQLLDVSETGVMGYIEIPSIDCSLPFYHGVDEAVLQVAVGHIEWSSLPIGGESTHTVLSGHRGLPSAKLFSELDRLTEGDIFTLHVLDDVLTYEVDQIRIVEPQELDQLSVEPGKDYCTLVTCTPYGINSHRLLVRGSRTENQREAVRVTADAVQIEPMVVVAFISVPFFLLLLGVLLIKTRKDDRR